MSTITQADLPALHNSASLASLSAQRTYLNLTRLNLILLSSAALSAAISTIDPTMRVGFVASSLICFVISIVLVWVLKARRPERDWYGGRAIAESVKTIAWRYMMNAEPYEHSLPSKDVDKKFTGDLGQILNQRKYLLGALDGSLANNEQITMRMRKTRALDLESRKAIYVECRIRDQRNWYSEKSSINKWWEKFWFYLTLIVQLVAVVSALVLIWNPSISFNLTGLCASVASGFVAWVQLKRFQELVQSYNLAAQELGLVEANTMHVISEEEFSSFVGDSENAISREHTMWIARRDQG